MNNSQELQVWDKLHNWRCAELLAEELKARADKLEAEFRKIESDLFITKDPFFEEIEEYLKRSW